MQFINKFLRNLALLIVLGIVLYLVAPDIMRQVYEFFGLFFGPAVILMIIVAALPGRRRS